MRDISLVSAFLKNTNIKKIGEFEMCLISTTTAIDDAADYAAGFSTPAKQWTAMQEMVREVTGFKDLTGFERQMRKALDKKLEEKRAPDPDAKYKPVYGGPRGYGGGGYSFGFDPTRVVHG